MNATIRRIDEDLRSLTRSPPFREASRAVKMYSHKSILIIGSLPLCLSGFSFSSGSVLEDSSNGSHLHRAAITANACPDELLFRQKERRKEQARDSR